MKAKEVFCELVEESIDGAYCLPTVDDQQSVQNAEPRNLRNRNKRHQVGSKVKERTGFKMKLRSHCVASDNSIHKNKHTANKLFKNEDDCNKISQTKTKGASSKDDSFEIKSDSICRKVPSKRETSIVVNFSPESTKKKVSRARKSKSNKYSEQAIISGDNNINKDKGHPRKSERPKRNSLSREFGGTPTKKKKVCTSSTDKSEVKNITPQSSAGAKEETKDTNLTETKSEITKKADLSRDTVQSAIRKVFLTLVDHLDPKTIIHKMLESEKYRHSNLRDIMDIINTSDRNRKLLDWISRRNITVYTHFKQCLLETRQNLLFKLLEIAEEDGDTSEITTHIIQNTIGLNSEGNKLYSELVAIADLRNRRIICFVFEYIGTTVCRALFMKKVNDLNPNDGEWTMDTFLNINRQNIEKIKHHSVKCGSDIIFPRAQLDSWGVSLFCLILINIFEITPSLRLCLEWVLDQREKICEYNDKNQNRKLTDLKKYLITIAAETEDDDLIKTVEEHFSQLEKGVLPNTDCEAITRSINHSKEEIIEEGRSNRDSIIDSCQQGQSEIKYVIRKGDKKIENKLDTILAEVQQLNNNACRNRGDQSVPATTMVKILVRGSESDVSICSQIVEAIKCRGTPSQLSDAVEEVRLKFQSKNWTIVNAEVGCIELYIQCSSVVSLLTLLKDYVNGNLDAYLEPLEKAARLLDGNTDLEFETVFYEESFYNILSSIDFRQFELSSKGSQEDRQTLTNGGNKAKVEFIEVINVEGSELDNLKERKEENQDLLVDDPNTRLILLGLNFGHESEKVEKHLPGMSPISDETGQCTSSNTKQSLEIPYTSQRLSKLQNSSPPRKPVTDQSSISREKHLACINVETEEHKCDYENVPYEDEDHLENSFKNSDSADTSFTSRHDNGYESSFEKETIETEEKNKMNHATHLRSSDFVNLVKCTSALKYLKEGPQSLADKVAEFENACFFYDPPEITPAPKCHRCSREIFTTTIVEDEKKLKDTQCAKEAVEQTRKLQDQDFIVTTETEAMIIRDIMDQIINKLEACNIELEEIQNEMKNRHLILEQKYSDMNKGHSKLEKNEELANRYFGPEEKHVGLANGHSEHEGRQNELENRQSGIEQKHSVLENGHLELDKTQIELENRHLGLEQQTHRARSVPDEFMDDPYAIKLYETALLEGKERDRHIRVIIIGRWSQGKTSIMRRLIRLSDENKSRTDIQKCLNITDDDAADSVDKMPNFPTNSKCTERDNQDTHAEVKRQQEARVEMQILDHKRKFKEKLTSNACLDSKDNSCSFDSWDFGGQFIYYATHPLFLSRRAIYVLVCDLSTPLSQTVFDTEFPLQLEEKTMAHHFEFLINSIHSFVGSKDGKEPTVLLVGTHNDKISGNDEKKSKYVQKYFRNVRDMFANTSVLNHIFPINFQVNTECSNDIELEALCNAIQELGVSRSNTNEIPAKWIQLEKSLNEYKHEKIMTLDRIQIIDSKSEHPLGEVEQIKLFLRYHHEKGTYMFFDESPISDQVIIDPQFLIDAFKTLISSKNICRKYPVVEPLWNKLQSEARLEQELIDHIWDIGESFGQHKTILLSFLEKHRIISKASSYDEDRKSISSLSWYIVPSLLRKTATENEIAAFLNGKDRTPLRFSMVFTAYSILPLIFHRITAALTGRWPIAEIQNTPLLFQNLCIVEINCEYAGVSQMKQNCIDLFLVNTSTSRIQTRREHADHFRRFVLSVVMHEFRHVFIKLQKNDGHKTTPYEVKFRCNHVSHGIDGSSETIDNETVNEQHVHCSHINMETNLRDWYTDSPLTNSDTNCVLNDRMLSKLANCIGSNWEYLGCQLGLLNEEIDKVIEDNPGNTLGMIFSMLRKWSSKKGSSATMHVLILAMTKCSEVNIDWDEVKNIEEQMQEIQ